MEKNKGVKKIMSSILLVIFILIAIIIIFFKMPYSKTKSEFNNVINSEISKIDKTTNVFTEEDIKDLPLPVQKYFRYCGYLGTPKMSYMKATFNNVDFKMSAEKTIKIDYIQYNFVDKPNRFAFIDSSIYGIPFEGFDSYNNGIGSMKGTIAKIIPLFDQRGETMDSACLVTFLAECLFVPNSALQDYIKWETIDNTHAKATITYDGASASGVFTFDENGAMMSFVTSDRVATDMDGSTREAEWSAIINEYHKVNGFLQPKVVQSIWHYPEGDSIYFNENKSSLSIELN
ncbi:DUF6544 family protein [Sedimentibacter sp. MB31-C6]|uniref:DUF6544 family protein n=1 Tax=Sedimentibacter sp. MB31-C6 TaxID=3109366 RepID=UPI002DDDA0E6|nr:DUF6544 family protein [Sedimentibacter sp. MB36-C1]WSI03709.1 DUF6544 family protein [Sedimentibacter sp. MB36-C1]